MATAGNLVIKVNCQPIIEGLAQMAEALALASFSVERLGATGKQWPDPFFILSRRGRTTRWKKDDTSD